MHSSRRSQRKFSLATDDIKLSLLDHTEKLLVTLCHQLESSSRREVVELRVWAHLQLAQASLTLHHGLTAVQLSLAAMRLLQREGGAGRRHLYSWDLAMVYGCVVVTATFPSLVPPWSPLLTVADHVM